MVWYADGAGGGAAAAAAAAAVAAGAWLNEGWYSVGPMTGTGTELLYVV